MMHRARPTSSTRGGADGPGLGSPAVGAMLGEGPVWIGNAVWFVDIKGHKVHRFDPLTKAHKSYEAPDQVGWVLPAEGGGLVTGVKTGLHRLDPETGCVLAAPQPRAATPGQSAQRRHHRRPRPAVVRLDGRRRSADDRLSLPLRRRALCATPACHPVAITNGPALNADAHGTLPHRHARPGDLPRCRSTTTARSARRRRSCRSRTAAAIPTGRWSMPTAACGPASTPAGACGATIHARQADQDHPPADRQRHQDVLRRPRPEDRLCHHRAQGPRRRRSVPRNPRRATCSRSIQEGAGAPACRGAAGL